MQAIPGCCAAVCAPGGVGAPTGRFCFEGFLSANKKERRARLEELRGEERTMVFHEAPQLRPTLADMLEVLGDRPVAPVPGADKSSMRRRCAPLCPGRPCIRRKSPREYVRGGRGPADRRARRDPGPGVRQVLRLRQEGVRMKDAVRRTAEETGLSRNDLYNAALAEMESLIKRDRREPVSLLPAIYGENSALGVIIGAEHIHSGEQLVRVDKGAYNNQRAPRSTARRFRRRTDRAGSGAAAHCPRGWKRWAQTRGTMPIVSQEKIRTTRQ